MTPDTLEPRQKKSVALSGVAAGNTSICTVGQAGNDLHYRGYSILELAEHTTFEEVARLLVYGELPTVSADPPGTRAKSAAVRITEPSRRISALRSPYA